MRGSFDFTASRLPADCHHYAARFPEGLDAKIGDEPNPDVRTATENRFGRLWYPRGTKVSIVIGSRDDQSIKSGTVVGEVVRAGDHLAKVQFTRNGKNYTALFKYLELDRRVRCAEGYLKP